MSFIQLIRILWARKAIILLTLLCSVAGAWLVVKFIPPRFEGTSRVMLEIVKPDPVTGQMMSSQYARAYVATQIELIRDYRIAGKVVDEFGWTSSPQMAARYAARSKDDKRDFRRWLAQIIIDGTHANLIPGSNILEIGFSSTSPEVAAKAADAIRDAYIDQTLVMKREAARRNAQWFRQQASKLSNDLAAAEKRKTDFERENGIVLQADNSDTEEARLAALASTAPAAPVPAAAAAATSGPSAALLAQIDAQIASLSQTLGPNHPQLQNLKRQRAAVAQAASREQATVRIESGPSLSSQLSAQTQKVLAQRGKVGEAQRLAADVSVLRDQYNKALQRVADLDQEAQSTDAGITVLGDASIPESPNFPNVPRALLGAVAFGLGLGLFAAMIIELLSRRVRGVEDLAIRGVPVIGTMATVPSAKSTSGRTWPGIRNPFVRRVTE